MSPAEDFDDEAIAQLLTEDARKSSARYASQGLSALLPKRANLGARKPNTRFLKNLVRDADSHNAALRRKEEHDRRERLRKLDWRGQDQPLERPIDEEDQNGDGRDDRQRKRRRLGGHEDRDDHDRLRRKERSHKHRRRNTSSAGSRSPERNRKKHKSHGKRGASPGALNEDRDRVAHRKHHRRRSRSKSHSPPPHRRSVVKAAREETREHNDSRSSPSNRSSSSSDPLEDLVGPLPSSEQGTSPPLRSRGRGAYKQPASVMDSHFSSAYDPTLDVHADSEDSAEKGDWDLALEALRDRQQWKQKHADRMRAAGFGDEEVKKWEESGKEKSAGDLKWRKAGEGREWDAGKSSVGREVEPRSSRKTDSDLQASWKRRSGGLLKSLNAALV